MEDCACGTSADGGRSTGMRGQPLCQQAQGHTFCKPLRSDLRTDAAVRLMIASSLAAVHQTSFHQGRTKRGWATKDSGCAVHCSSTSAESNAPSPTHGPGCGRWQAVLWVPALPKRDARPQNTFWLSSSGRMYGTVCDNGRGQCAVQLCLLAPAWKME